MDSLIRLLKYYLSRFWTTPYPITSLIGLAGCIFAVYQLLGGRRKEATARQPPAAAVESASGATATATSGGAATSTPQAQQSTAQQTRQPGILQGVRQVTISALGVLLHESSPSDLENSATLRPDAAALLRRCCCACSTVVLAQVESDIGEATLRGALEESGLLGTGPGQLPPHRLLFCGTPIGKVSIVRQLDPQLHVDGSPQTVADLQRFIRRILHVTAGVTAGAGFNSNVELVTGLSFAFSE